jgi:hypothetical protein
MLIDGLLPSQGFSTRMQMKRLNKKVSGALAVVFVPE